MYGYIYKTTNILNNKIYIGKHKSDTFDPTYLGSGKLINRAIVTYGISNFKVEMLCECYSLDELNSKEKYYILNLRSNYIYGTGYNISSGGDGGATILHTRMVHNDNETKFILEDEVEEYLSSGYSLGHRDESKQRMRDNSPKYLGQNNPFYGKHHTEETKKIIGEKSKQKPMYGDNNPAKRPDVRKKISDKAKSRTYLKDHIHYINNGIIEQRAIKGVDIPEGFVVGRLKHCWIHDNNCEKFIVPQDIPKYLAIGFSLGRLPYNKRSKPDEF